MGPTSTHKHSTQHMKPSVKAIPRPFPSALIAQGGQHYSQLESVQSRIPIHFHWRFQSVSKKVLTVRDQKFGKLESANMLINLCASQGLIKLRSMVKLPGYYSMLGSHLAQMQLLRCSCSDVAAQMLLFSCSTWSPHSSKHHFVQYFDLNTQTLHGHPLALNISSTSPSKIMIPI